MDRSRIYVRQASHRRMSQSLASGQVLHAHYQLGTAPLSIRQSRGLKRSPRRGETLNLKQKVCPRIVTKRDECRPGVIQSRAVVMREQSPECPGLAVTISADHHKGGFSEALGLEPSFGATRAIRCQPMFGHNALKPPVRTCLEERGAVTYELFAELNVTFLIASEQNLQY